MNEQPFLIPDSRWSVWGCNSFEEYLNKYMIKGKFHQDVPKSIVDSYKIVEYLIAYSYFCYPMIEEAMAKITRIFEMAVKNRARTLSINCNRLSNCLNKLKEHPEIDTEMVDECSYIVKLRNFYAHPEFHSFSGPSPLETFYSILNSINRLFYNKTLFNELNIKIVELQQNMVDYIDGSFIVESGNNIQLVYSVKPFYISSNLKKSIWKLEPVYIDFPQTMKDFEYFCNPIFLWLTNLQASKEVLLGYDYANDINIRIYSTNIEGNLLATEHFKTKLSSADNRVKKLNDNNSIYLEYLEKQKFIYNEFWD